jgi:hypothetical protein
MQVVPRRQREVNTPRKIYRKLYLNRIDYHEPAPLSQLADGIVGFAPAYGGVEELI